VQGTASGPIQLEKLFRFQLNGNGVRGAGAVAGAECYKTFLGGAKTVQ
jgi:hypothetical protein